MDILSWLYEECLRTRGLSDQEKQAVSGFLNWGRAHLAANPPQPSDEPGSVSVGDATFKIAAATGQPAVSAAQNWHMVRGNTERKTEDPYRPAGWQGGYGVHTEPSPKTETDLDRVFARENSGPINFDQYADPGKKRRGE